MTPDEALTTLTAAFRALPPEQLESLRYHIEVGTRILCGAEAFLYQSADGGG